MFLRLILLVLVLIFGLLAFWNCREALRYAFENWPLLRSPVPAPFWLKPYIFLWPFFCLLAASASGYVAVLAIDKIARGIMAVE